VDFLTAIVFLATVLVLAARAVEIAVRRPEAFLELTAGARAFAEAALRESATMRSRVADRKIEVPPSEYRRLAA
jgi:hypothetical protein